MTGKEEQRPCLHHFERTPEGDDYSREARELPGPQPPTPESTRNLISLKASSINATEKEPGLLGKLLISGLGQTI